MNLVAIVGRPNVGKSTLFNRLVGKREAIVEDTPGVTRDRIYGKSDWNGKYFEVIDTGGFIPGSEDNMERAIREQAMLAIEEADSIIFVCDGREGLTKFDEDIGVMLRKSNKPVILVINKCDNPEQDNYAFEFYKLGLGDPFPISGVNGRNTGDFMDAVVEPLHKVEDVEEDERLKIAIVGRPNAGKSSLVNALLGKERVIVDSVPGTTRDSIDSVLKYYGEEVVLIDTAGLRKRTHISENVEMWSTVRTGRAIEKCDVAVLMVDVNRGLEDQDKKIINQINDARKGIIFVFNKWDLKEKDDKTHDLMVKDFYEKLKTFDYVPVIFTSVVEKQRIYKVVDLAKEIHAKRKNRIKTHILNDALIPIFEQTPPPSVRGHDLRINYVTQVGTEPPVFALFTNFPKLMPDSYKRFLERRIREKFDFSGTPISLIFRKKNVAWEERGQ